MLFEAVPNFSEGRDPELVREIVRPVREVSGVHVLDLSSDPDHNRSVLTLAGEREPLLEAAVALAASCMRHIDLEAQTGAHPRIGALDVLPFIPLQEATMEAAADLARAAGERLGESGIPVYLYEYAASAEHRRNLATVRRGGYEALKTRCAEPEWRPDFGPAELPRWGATAVGARRFLLAFNVFLESGAVEVARSIASELRERDGGLAGVKALGLLVEGRAQVSMNLTDIERTGLGEALEAVRRSARQRGVAVHSTELIGLAPLDAVAASARHYLGLRHLERGSILESRLWEQRR